MTRFCGKCGSPLNDAAVFCGGCGSSVGAVQVPVQATPAGPSQPASAFSPVPGYTPGPVAVAPPAKQSNTFLKVVVVCLVLLFVGGALAVGGIWYAAEQIKAKAQAATAQSPGLSAVAGAMGGLMSSVASNSDHPAEFKGDPCRFLSKQEVSQAVGLTVIRTTAQDNLCSYIAKGDPADVTAKHVASMLGGLGADAQTKKMVQGFAGQIFAQQESQDKSLSAEAAKGEVPVLVVSFTVGNAAAEMKLNRSSMRYAMGGEGNAASTGTGDLDGIGDEAYLAAGSMLVFRIGDTAARFVYVDCPCNTDNIKPLAKLAAARL